MSVIHFNNETFASQVKQGSGTALVDFWAPWCGPCQMMGPIVDQFTAEHSDILVGKVDTDQCPQLAQEYGVMTIPTLIVFKDGKEVARKIGVQPKAALAELVK